MEIDLLTHEAEKCRERLIKWRRRFHEHPELGLECHETAAVVAENLQRMGLQVKTNVAKSGVVGILYGHQTGPVVALRVDMDALPLEERTGLPFSSHIQGIMHACGHDGHTAMGLGVAAVLSKFRDVLKGAIKFIFQPGEESPGAAKMMIDEGVLQEPKVEIILGCHIFPGLSFGQVGIRYGTICAACDEFDIRIKGVGGHAAYPHQCTDPIVAACNLAASLQTIVSRSINPMEPAVISICKITGGNTYNVIPEDVSLGGTVRSVDEETRQIAHKSLKDIVRAIEVAYGVEIYLNIQPTVPALRCNEWMVTHTEENLNQLIGPEKVIHISSPSLGADDFAFFSEKIPAAYLRLGSYDKENGYVQGLHTPYFDFNENLLVEGTKILSFLLMTFLTSTLSYERTLLCASPLDTL